MPRPFLSQTEPEPWSRTVGGCWTAFGPPFCHRNPSADDWAALSALLCADGEVQMQEGRSLYITAPSGLDILRCRRFVARHVNGGFGSKAYTQRLYLKGCTTCKYNLSSTTLQVTLPSCHHESQSVPLPNPTEVSSPTPPARDDRKDFLNFVEHGVEVVPVPRRGAERRAALTVGRDGEGLHMRETCMWGANNWKTHVRMNR